MAKYTVILEEYSHPYIQLEAEGYGTNSHTGELYLYTKDEAGKIQHIANFARGEWTGCYLTSAVPAKS